MNIGNKLKEARTKAGYTQDAIAEKINVTRQTISNWENEKSYPDIIYIIELSDLYKISLDELLKGDIKMIEHLKESTNIVSSNKKLLYAIALNIVLLFMFILLNGVIVQNLFLIVVCASIMILSTSVLFYQIIKKI